MEKEVHMDDIRIPDGMVFGGLGDFTPKRYGPTPEELQEMAERAEREAIEAVRDPFERVRAMRESDVFTDKEVKDFIAGLRDLDGYDIPSHGPSVKTRLIVENGDLYGHPELMEPPAPPAPLPTSEEIYGGPTTVTVTDADGNAYTRPATPEDVKRMRRAEVLAIKNPDERLRAISENIDAFRSRI